MTREFIGRGWAFPLQADVTGGIMLVDRGEEVAQSIRIILGTAKGERPMRPDFGCGIHDLAFSVVDANAAGQFEQEVRSSLERWEPRIEVTAVRMIPGSAGGGTVYVDVHYLLRETNDLRNLVFPFYVIPAEEGQP